MQAFAAVDAFQLPLSLDLSAVTLGSIQGAMFAAGFKRIDLLGVSIIGTVAGLGGGLLRDIMLGVTPAALQSNWYLLVAVLGSFIGMLLNQLFMRVDGLITLLDALSIGMYAALGTTKALAAGLPVVPSLFVGTLAAVGGGVLRDLLLNIPISVLQVGSLYAIAALAGSVSIIVSLLLGASVAIAGIVCVVVTTLVRLLAVRFGWSLPEQRAIKQRRQRQMREVTETIEALRTGVIDIDELSRLALADDEQPETAADRAASPRPGSSRARSRSRDRQPRSRSRWSRRRSR